MRLQLILDVLTCSKVYAPLVKRLGISMDITVQKRYVSFSRVLLAMNMSLAFPHRTLRGFYPRGGGEILVTTQPLRRLESFGMNR